MKKFFCFIWLTYLTLPMVAQEVLSLDSCRALAIANNKELLISQEKSMRHTIRKKRHSPIICPIFPHQADICVTRKNFLC